MAVSIISFISSKPVSLLQTNSIWVWIFISKEVPSENIGLLCSRSMSQPRLKVSVNDSLDDILCIAEPFVIKPSMARHHYKPECHMRKICFYLEGQGHSNWISVHTMKYDYFYMFWTEKEKVRKRKEMCNLFRPCLYFEEDILSQKSLKRQDNLFLFY